MLEPQQLSSSQGATVDLPCRLSPSGDIRWSRARGSLPVRATQVRNILRIENVTVEDSGRYVCTSGGRVQYVTLTVESKVFVIHTLRKCVNDFRDAS